MSWNWQKSDWPKFRWDRARLAVKEEKFLLGAGVAIGAIKHLTEDERYTLTVELMSTEAVTTSAIEGEVLNRDSVQSSILYQLGLMTSSKRRVLPAEQGIAEMMVEVYRSSPEPLSSKMMFDWHRKVMLGRSDLPVGRFRVSREPMQVISGRIGEPKVHFEGPPSKQVHAEMQRFIAWFNQTAVDGKASLPALTRAGTAHLYFESIHPFEDGNGRIGRALAEKAITQTVHQPVLVGLATSILLHRKDYYDALERANRRNEITEWLEWFAEIAIEAQRNSLAQVEFVIAKAKLLDRLRNLLNERQEKALLRLFRAGPEGFKGGLSASNYVSITGASPATTTRDLADLVEKGALIRAGERKHTRYTLNLSA